MTNHKIDNSLTNFKKVVLWQYDKAYRLLSILKHMNMLYVVAIERFWQYWAERILAIDTCRDFGHSVWGKFLGTPIPTIVDETGTTRFVAPAIYKKILKGAFHLMKTSSSFDGILGYLEIVFGIDGNQNLTKWVDSVSEYGWTTNVDELNFKYEANRSYPQGYVFWYDVDGTGAETNWRCERDITAEENTSFVALQAADLIDETLEYPTGSNSNDTIFLKLIDPEGYVRKLAAGPRDALSINLSYRFGDYTITASVMRVQKCGVSIVDNGDMSITYVKTPYYDNMHRDQKFLFEQKMDDVCPYPLGIKTNEPAETWLFGFDGQQPLEDDKYKAGVAYSEGDVVWTLDEDPVEYHGFHWKFTRDVSASENTSFEAIRDYMVKTSEGDPFVSGIADTEACDFPQKPWSNWDGEDKTMGTVRNYVYLVNGKTYSYMYALINGNSLVKCFNNADVPVERLSLQEVPWMGYLEGLVLPIETEIWQKAISDSCSNGTISSRLYPSDATGQVFDLARSQKKETPIKDVAYERGYARSGTYYRSLCLMNIDGEYRYVKTGGTYEGAGFRKTNTVAPDRTNLKMVF